MPVADTDRMLSQVGLKMRTIFSLAVLAALTGILAGAEASAAVRIADVTGGQIGSYFEKYSAMRRSGEKVVVDEPCVSACTMVLGLVPHARLCRDFTGQLWISCGLGP
jgi:hypothetical protein